MYLIYSTGGSGYILLYLSFQASHCVSRFDSLAKHAVIAHDNNTSPNIYNIEKATDEIKQQLNIHIFIGRPVFTLWIM